MTSLVAWIGVDNHGPSSAYLASDSRISWNPSGQFDSGRKIFASRSYPDILGYCGDVLFPLQVLGQITESIDLGTFFEKNDSLTEKQKKIYSRIVDAHTTYPREQRELFRVIHCSRTGESIRSEFHFVVVTFQPGKGWSQETLKTPSDSGVVEYFGSGKPHVRLYAGKWERSEIGRTSRGVYGAFCDSLRAGGDKLSGGPPQLACIYRKGGGIPIGVIHQGQRYLKWRNELFERCDGRSLSPLTNAQRQPRPGGLR